MAGFERRWLLYVAALYHDIAKGRGGDHSELGAADVRSFSKKASAFEERTASWSNSWSSATSRMSHVAQKQDVYDPDVVKAFAELVGSERRLVALYLFTVADVRGTSPKVWNAWKGKLLEDLFRATPPRAHRRAARARRRARREAGRGRAAAAPLRAVRHGSRTSCGRASTPPTSCATTRRRSPGRRATCTTASIPTSRWSRRASRRSARACR